MATVGTYQYSIFQDTYPERQIAFVRPGAPSSIYAELYSLDATGQRVEKLATIPGTNITVEMNSTSQKLRAAMMPGILQEDQNLSQLSLPHQNALLGSLVPSGVRKIECEGGIVNKRAVELATMSIFDPS